MTARGIKTSNSLHGIQVPLHVCLRIEFVYAKLLKRVLDKILKNKE